MDAVRLASILFIAGIGATAGLLATAFQALGEDSDLQQLLRDDSTQIPNFIEETLRIAHGPAGARTYKYVPTYLSRSLRRLHLDLIPV